MSDKIIALVDGSIYSHSVCDHAAWVATRAGAPVEVMHVLARPEGVAGADLSGSIRLGARTALLQELASLDEKRAKLMQHHGRALLDDAKARVEAAGVRDVSTRLRHGDIVEAVATQEAGAAMIVIGKRGEAADFAKGHLGSNLERIVRASHKPVLVASRAFRAVGTVLVACDGGASSTKAVAHVAQSPVYAGLSVTLVWVGADTAEAQKVLADALAIMRAAGAKAETLVLPGQPDTALGAHVEVAGVDLVVMGAYGHSRIRSLIIGSTTTAMVRSCKVPVVLVR
ncbi:universal stress protein [Phaeovulum sp.]|uniref:universal stress protein n=1 Tax=Phaeovulum sp. TaxID=2934796 RepID=UPI0039E2C611